MTLMSPAPVCPLDTEESRRRGVQDRRDVESKGMSMSKMKRILISVATILTLAWLTAGCNTLHGAGEDLEAGGEAIQDAAD